jgi:hypothetical protein
MKGKLLSYQEIENLKDGDKVWVEYILTYGVWTDVAKDGVQIFRNASFYDSQGLHFTVNSMLEFCKKGYLKIYEYTKDSQDEQTITKEDKEAKKENVETISNTYVGWQILKMISEDKLQDDNIILDRDGDEWFVKDIKSTDVDSSVMCQVLLDYAPFTIKQKPVDFMTAINSGKFIRPVSLNKIKNFESFRYWLDFIASYSNWSNDSLDLINDLWEIDINV